MKIHAASHKNNALPKLISIFPFFISFAPLGMWLKNSSLIALFFALLLLFIAIYTFFYTRKEKYIDVEKRKIIKSFHWLWINLYEEESIDHFESVCICLGDFLPDSNFTDKTGSFRYDIGLIRKYTSSETMLGFGSIENFPIHVAIKTTDEAKDLSNKISTLLNMQLVVAEKVTRHLKYDILEYKKEF